MPLITWYIVEIIIFMEFNHEGSKRKMQWQKLYRLFAQILLEQAYFNQATQLPHVISKMKTNRKWKIIKASVNSLIFFQ